MATRLNQIIAVEKGVKSDSYSKLTELYQLLQKAPLLSGIARSYTPKDEEGDKLPSESTRVQINAENTLVEIATALTRLFDVVLTKDVTNCVAKADVVIGDKVIIKNAPATYLIFLEKQLTDLHTYIKKLPVLDPAEEWKYDNSADCWATQPVQTVRTKKVPKAFVKYEHTKEHPAQVDTFTEDILVGYWSTVKFSGAMQASRVNELTSRVETLIRAVKYAREQANMQEVTDQKIGDSIFSYLLAK